MENRAGLKIRGTVTQSIKTLLRWKFWVQDLLNELEVLLVSLTHLVARIGWAHVKCSKRTNQYCHAPNPTIKIGTWQPLQAYKVSHLQVCKAFLATKIYPQIKSIKSKIPQQFLYEWISNNLIGTKSKPYVHNANWPINIKLFEDPSIPKSLSFLFRSQHNIRTSKTCYSS